jgi:hypothetical protein
VSLRDRLIALLPPALLVVTVTAFYFGALIHPETIQAINVDGGDVINYFRPHAIDQFRYARDIGGLSLWNDRVGLGAPAIGQFGNYYPPRIAALSLASAAGMAADLLTWGHTLVAALATYALLRLYGIGRWSAVLGGQLFALAHLAVRWAPLFHAPAYFAALPLSVLGLELIWRRRALLGVPLLALAIAMTVLGGHLQNAHLLLQTVGVFLVFRLLTDPEPWRARLRPLGASVGAIVLGCLTSAPALASFLVQQSSSTRQHSEIENVAGLTARQLASAFDPLAAMAKIDLNADLYLGLVAPVLIVAGIVVAVRSRALAPMLVLLALSLLIGFKTPVLNVLMAIVPGWEVVSNVARMSFVMTLPLAVLAAAGLDALLRRVTARQALLGGAALLVLSAGYWSLRTRGEPTTGWIVAAAAVVAAGGLALLALRPSRLVAAAVAVPVALTLVTLLGSVQERKLGWEPEPDTTPAMATDWLDLVARTDSDGRWMSYCQELQYPQYRYRPVMFLERRGRWLDTYDSFIAKDYYAYWSALTGSHRWDKITGGQWDMHTPQDPLPNANLTDAAGIRKVLGTTNCFRDVSQLGWTPELLSNGFIVYDNAGAYPDAYLSRRWAPARDPQDAIERLKAPRTTFDEHTDFVEGAVGAAPTGDDPAAARVQRADAEHLSVALDRPTTQPELLVLLDHYAAGWTARAGGQDLPIRRVNGTFRGVVVPTGTERVQFEYAPWWDRVLGPLSLLLLAALLVWALVAVVLEWRRDRSVPLAG